MSSLNNLYVIPLLTPNRTFNVDDETQHHWRSVRLDFSFESGFQAAVLCSNTAGHQYGSALVESKSIVVGSFKEQLQRMASQEVEKYILRNFAIKVEKSPNNSFKVIIGPQTSSSQPPHVGSTTALAEQLRLLPTDHPHYPILQGIALAVVEEFSRTQNKTKPLIDEVVAIASAHNTAITRALLKSVIKEIKQNELLEVDLLKSLSTTLVNAYIEAIDPDDLIQILIIINERMTRLHQQDKTSYKLYAVLSVLTDILDLMSDANVMQMSRADLHDPLYKTLDGLSNGGQLVIAAQAAYGKQALVRLPNDESKFSAFCRRGKALASAFASLYSVVSDKDLFALLDAYTNFKEATESKQGKKPWYNFIRMLKLICMKEKFDELTKIISKESKETLQDPYVVGSVLTILYDLVQENSNRNVRKWALKMMTELFLNDELWGSKKELKKGILEKIVECASHPDRETGDYAKNLLGSLETSATTKTHRSMIDVVIPEDLKEIQPREFLHVEPVSTFLITAAQRSNFISLEQKIEQLREQTLKNEEILKELASYIPIQGSRSLFDPKVQVFDMNKAINQFIQSDKKVFLLLGDSGGGKSTYLRYLENLLWKQWTPKNPIPLFIGLPSLKNPYQEAITEALKRCGFTQQEQKELKQNYRFLFLLDGYDEIKQRQNLYVSNQLNEWKAQTIITCRSQYLSGEQSSYQNFFAPPKENLISPTSMDEASVAPFSQQQIESYCRKFIGMYKIPRTWEQYQADIASIPDLQEIIETPFILRIICEVLPQIIQERHQSQEKLSLLRIELFDAFIKNWFDREELRLIKTGAWTENSDVKKLFDDFARKLASEMLSEGIVAVEIEENYDFFNQETSKWSRFFSSDARIAMIRSGVPIRKMGPSSYAFIHKSLLEYFGTRAILPSQPKQKIRTQSIPNEEEKSQNLRQSNSIPFSIQTPLSVSTTASSTPQQTSFPLQKRNSQEVSISFNKPILENEKKSQNLASSLNSISLPIQTSLPVSPPSSRSSSIPNPPIKKLSQPLPIDSNLPIIPSPLIQSSVAIQTNVSTQKRDNQADPISFTHLNRRILTQEPEIIKMLAECVKKETNLQNILFDFIERSKIDPTAANAAANAITILNAAEVHLNLRDFKGIRIPGADLSQAILTNTDLSHADLRNVKMEMATLDYSTMAYSETEGIDFGQKILIKEQNSHYMVLSPDGKQLLYRSDNNTLKLWDCTSEKEIHCFQGHTGPLRIFAFSPDGKRIVSGSNDKTIRFWNSDTGVQICSLEGLIILSIAFSPDGKWVAFGGWGDTVRLWDSNQYKELQRFKERNNKIFAVAFSPDSKQIASASSNTITLWDCTTGKKLKDFIGHKDNVTNITFSSNGKRMLSGSVDLTVSLWNIETGEELLCLEGHLDCVTCVAFSPDGKSIISASCDKTIRLWDSTTGQLLHCFLGHLGEVFNVTFSPDGKWIFSASADNTIRSWALPKTGSLKKNLDSLYFIGRLFLTRDGKKIFSTSRNDHKIRVWDSATGKMLNCIKGHSAFVIDLDISPDGNWLLSGSDDHTVRLWNCSSGKQLQCFQGHTITVSSVAFSPDGKSIISGSLDNIKLWDCSNGNMIHSFQEPKDSIYEVDFFPNGKWMLSQAYRTIKLWDYTTGKEIHRFEHLEPIGSYAISLDSKWVATTSKGENIKLWDCNTGKNLYSIKGHSADINKIIFSPDNKMILSCSDDKTFKLWDCITGKELDCFQAHSDAVKKVLFSPDGKIILSVGKDKTVKLWDWVKRKEVFKINLRYDIQDITFLPDGQHILFADLQPSLQLWQIINQKNGFKLVLLWSKGNRSLSADNLDLKEAKGLSDSNRRLLKQHHAINIGNGLDFKENF